MKRVFEVDPLVCPKCGNLMKIKAFITDAKEITRLCNNLGIAPWRAPPKFGARSGSDTPVVDFFDGWQSSNSVGNIVKH